VLVVDDDHEFPRKLLIIYFAGWRGVAG
jgi:hypothetical protein